MNAAHTPPRSTAILIVGAGPAGSAAATRLARAGHDVVLADASSFPRDKTCGDGLTPRAVAELTSLGMGDYLADRPRIIGLELNGWGTVRRVPWPVRDARLPDWGSAIARMQLDNRIRDGAIQAGAKIIAGAKAVSVDRDGDRIRAVRLRTSAGLHEITADSVIVADGVRSALGKELGRIWHRDTAYGVAARAYATSARSSASWMGSHLELRDDSGELLPGYGWVFPLGNGTVNLGVGALATAKRPAQLALRQILNHYAQLVRDEWQLSGQPVRVASALLPMGGAVSGVSGRNWMLIGDAAACVNPLNGEGIDYALETARLATYLVEEPDYRHAWRETLIREYGAAFSAARRLSGLLTVPRTVPLFGKPAMRSGAIMSMVVRVMGNLMTEDDSDIIAHAWRTAGRISTVVDTRPPFT